MSKIELQPVDGSSVIAATGHDPASDTMHVEFHSGALHEYDDVSAEEHAALVGAPSVGQHFGTHVLRAGKRSRRIR